ncbi:hypothetical protein BDZ97DRAFT_1841577 [Flammula alnicola]|nr:hypothetical protein BDZ97DRAFT_1841577 [Flammula alnicola]
MSTTPNTTPGPSSTTATAPKFSFGTSAFSNQPSAQEPVKSAFGGNTNTSSAFSSTAGSGPSPFGVTPAQTQNVFYAGANKPADAPKPFTPATNGASSTTTSTPKPFDVDPTATTTPATGPGGQFSFKFGQTEPLLLSRRRLSVFGGAQGGNATTTTTPQSVFGSSAFGAAPPSQQQQQ